MENTFTEKLLFGDDEKRYWSDESENLYFFSSNNSGYIINTLDERIDFSWKINSKGILAIKENNLLYFLKIKYANDDNTIFCKKYEKENNELLEKCDMYFIYDTYKDIEKENKMEITKNILKIIKNFNEIDYLVFAVTFTFMTCITFLVINHIVFIKSLSFLLQCVIYLIIMYSVAGFYFEISLSLSERLKLWIKKDSNKNHKEND